eukprot:TRINITY_DN8138_c0_g2_i1.p1 TRINITY_DN8138_c0_g2~~TRINITY_DN8138_c0_g2_i1.p1  ORF type:complete len:476 (+),score=22.58 TRINITY_DN8138_c0_g2_i1:163-1428(+)
MSASSYHFEHELKYVENLTFVLTSPRCARGLADESSNMESETSASVEARIKPCVQENVASFGKRFQEIWEPSDRAQVGAGTSKTHGNQRGEDSSPSARQAFSSVSSALVQNTTSSCIDSGVGKAFDMRDDGQDVQGSQGLYLHQLELTTESEGYDSSYEVQEDILRIHDAVESEFLRCGMERSDDLIGITHCRHVAKPHPAQLHAKNPLLNTAERAGHIVQKDDGSANACKVSVEPLSRANVAWQNGASYGTSTNHAASSKSERAVIASMQNSGSLGHPELCGRPCIRIVTGSCFHGSSCGFCHLPHGERVVHLDRKKREMLKRMTLGKRVATILPVVRQRVIQLGLDQECVQMINEILLQVCGENGLLHSNEGSWTKFTLRTLLGMLKPDTDETSSELLNTLHHLSLTLKTRIAAVAPPA